MELNYMFTERKGDLPATQHNLLDAAPKFLFWQQQSSLRSLRTSIS